MAEATARRLEAIVDLGASIAFGGASAWSGAILFGPFAGAGAGAVGCVASWAALRRVGRVTKPFAVRVFDLRDIDIVVDELVLTEADRIDAGDPQELMLDDELLPPGPEARVVRLFDVSAMPTPGELKARIDQHLAGPQSAPPDASQALFEALADLRSSLR